MHLFLSYTRSDAQHLPALIDGLKRLRHQVWFDQDLNGGQQWWDEVLRSIRAADALLLALTPDVLESEACTREVGYARAVGRPIVPVMLEPVLLGLLPPELSALQLVDFTPGNPHGAFDLMGALGQLPGAGPLPEPLPPPPPVPVSYLSGLSERLQAPSLALDEQLTLVGKLRQGLEHPRERDAVLQVIRRLRARNDLYLAPARELDALLAETGAAGPPTSWVRVTPPPQPASPAPRAASAQPVTPAQHAATPPPAAPWPVRPPATATATAPAYARSGRRGVMLGAATLAAVVVAALVLVVVHLGSGRGNGTTTLSGVSVSGTPSPAGSGRPAGARTPAAVTTTTAATTPAAPAVSGPVDVTAQPSGLLCRDLQAKGYSYSAAVTYWQKEGQPHRMDVDENGIPCETVYSTADISAFRAGG